MYEPVPDTSSHNCSDDDGSEIDFHEEPCDRLRMIEADDLRLLLLFDEVVEMRKQVRGMY